MRTRDRLRVVLILLCAVCAALAGWLIRSHAQGRLLATEIADLKRTFVAASVSEPATASEAPPLIIETNAEFAARAALLAEARRIPEVARRESALRAIRRLKTGHAVLPPPPKPLPPPLPKNFGSEFPELMTDPEYRALAFQRYRAAAARYDEIFLAELGVASNERRQIVELRKDDYLIEDVGVAPDVVRTMTQRRERNLQKVRAILGEETWRRYEGGNLPELEFGSLAARLSYSSTPLTPADLNELVRLRNSNTFATSIARYGSFQNLEFIDQARAFLEPEQVEGMLQLHAEYEARELRNKLPKSSELPRTKRRAKQATAN